MSDELLGRVCLNVCACVCGGRGGGGAAAAQI